MKGLLVTITLWLMNRGWVSKDKPATDIMVGVIMMMLLVMGWVCGFISAAFIAWLIP